MKTNKKMQCPKCNAPIDVDSLLVLQFEESVRKDILLELRERDAEFGEEKRQFAELKKQFEKEKLDIESSVNERVKKQIQIKEDEIRAAIKKQVEEEKSIQLQELEKELIDKTKRIKDLNGTQAQLERLKREMEETETRITLQKEKELNDRLEKAKLDIKEQTQMESFLKIKEREQVIEELRLKLEDAKRKAEQGSVQRQGEVQEISIQEFLTELYPTDEIIPIGKGVNGADILHVIKTQSGATAGSIYFESKRTKTWSDGWINKLKNDNLETKADILVIVTEAMPTGIKNYGIVDGVWVCHFSHVKEMSLVLRYAILKIQAVTLAQHGRESKMEQLYLYLTSKEFKNVFESIIEGFRALQENHHAEKLRMQRIWKEREKLLERVLSGAVNFYGSIKGISESVPEIPMLATLSLPKAG
jgi:hypothetical protein